MLGRERGEVERLVKLRVEAGEGKASDSDEGKSAPRAASDGLRFGLRPGRTE